MLDISVTEKENKESKNLDKFSSEELVNLFAEDTLNVVSALKKC